MITDSAIKGAKFALHKAADAYLDLLRKRARQEGYKRRFDICARERQAQKWAADDEAADILAENEENFGDRKLAAGIRERRGFRAICGGEAGLGDRF